MEDGDCPPSITVEIYDSETLRIDSTFKDVSFEVHSAM